MKKILFTGFKGKTNSSKLLLDNINENKLYLTNSFDTSVKELYKVINEYDYIISIGQANLDENTLKIEKYASNIETNFNIDIVYNYLSKYYDTKISTNAGNYLCNNIYYYGLKKIYSENLKIKMIFIHIPKMKNIKDINKLSNIIEEIKLQIMEER